MEAAGQFLFILCATVYGGLAVILGWRAKRAAERLLAFACLATAGWAAARAAWDTDLPGSMPGALDLLRALAWYGYLLQLYRRTTAGAPGQERFFVVAGAALLLFAAISVADAFRDPAVTLLSLSTLVRVALSVFELLLIENLYLNLPEHRRWHVALPCVLLGGLACFDILLCVETALFRQGGTGLAGARAVAMVMIAPLLAVASTRGQRWHGKVQLSRTAVFRSATLILSGTVLLALGLAGEVFRRWGPDWGWMAEASLLFAGVVGLGLVATSGSARSRLRGLVVEHFFASRYDYRRQWLDCIDTLSGVGADERTAIHTRVIRTMANVVDSPSGVLFLREGGVGSFGWVGSWNMPAAPAVPATHPVVLAAAGGERIVVFGGADAVLAEGPPLDQLGRLWLLVPLVHRHELIGLVLLGPPRAPFKLDEEVFTLLRIVGREVATYVAEQRATQVMAQTRNLHDYSKRFAFVAHDIKNVSSQLALLLRNAESHISNPLFQQDMLETVRASVQKITALLKRLEAPETDRAPGALAPLPRLEALVATYRRVRQAELVLEHDGSTATVAMGADAFDTAITHLLNNAVEASAGKAVLVRVRHEVSQVVIEIEDKGPGMTPEFVRDQLFRPFGTAKRGGTGIGAFQARELIQEGGGDLAVTSHKGIGTTMRITLARVDAPAAPVPMEAEG